MALRTAGAHVGHAFVVFRYGILDAVVREEQLGVDPLSLLAWQEVLVVAQQIRAFPESTLERIEEYITDPLHWSEKHGGIGPTAFADKLDQRGVNS